VTDKSPLLGNPINAGDDDASIADGVNGTSTNANSNVNSTSTSRPKPPNPSANINNNNNNKAPTGNRSPVIKFVIVAAAVVLAALAVGASYHFITTGGKA